MLGPLWEGVQKKLLDSGQIFFFLFTWWGQGVSPVSMTVFLHVSEKGQKKKEKAKTAEVEARKKKCEKAKADRT